MAFNLKMELFAYKLFYKLWNDMEEIQVTPDILEIYGDECVRDDSYMEACDDSIIRAVYCRSEFFCNKYIESFSSEEIIKIKTLSELYDYVVRMCDRDDLFGHLTVFERMLATSDFVAAICYSIYLKTDSFADVLMYGHIIWAMYFDKFTEEFYEKGGWSKLKIEVKCYELLSELYIICYGKSKNILQVIKEAIVNYRHFKNAINYPKQKNQYTFHISKLWIQFRIEHFESYINIPLSYESSVNAYEVDLLLDDLKLLSDPTRCNPDNLEVSKEKQQGSTFSKEMSCSEIHISEKRKANQDDETHIKPISFEHENRNIDEVPKVFSHITADFREESQSSCQTSTPEELTIDIIDTNINLGLVENTFSEMKQTGRLKTKYSHDEHSFLPFLDIKRRNETSIKNLPDVSDFYLNHNCGSKLHENKNEKGSAAFFYEGNTEEQDEIINKHQGVSIYQMKETKSQRMSSLKQQAHSNVLGFTSERGNIGKTIGNCKETIETSFCSKNEWIEIAKTVDDSSSSEIAAPDRNGKTTTGQFPTLKDFSSVKENANTKYEINRIRKAREDLRHEQKNHEVKNFLRMLPVLGDIEGTKFVLSTLKNIGGSDEHSDEKSDKQKKNSKKN